MSDQGAAGKGRARGGARGRAQGRGLARFLPIPEPQSTQATAGITGTTPTTPTSSLIPSVQAWAVSSPQPSGGFSFAAAVAGTSAGSSAPPPAQAQQEHQPPQPAPAATIAPIKQERTIQVESEEERVPSVIRSRPEGLESKQGSSGTAIQLVANYYEVSSKEAVILHHYHVSFEPDVEVKAIRCAAQRQWREQNALGGLFDGGNALYTTASLTGEITHIFNDPKGKVDPIKMTIKYTRKVEPGSFMYITFFNRLVSEICRKLQLVPMRGKFYDREGIIDIPSHRLQLWPGLFQAIEHHESSLLMCVDAAFKVVRSDSVWDLMNRIRQDCRSNRPEDILTAWKSELVGTIVMATHNAKTYRVDDIDMNMHPTNNFVDQKSGQPVTFKDHFRRKSGIEITDESQPMLISFPTKRDIRRRRTENICLVPELCQATGLSDSMRSNFQLMGSIGKVIHAGPSKRVEIISGFMDRMQKNPGIRGFMQGWGLDLKRDLVRVQGRVLPPQKIVLRNDETLPEQTGDFTMGLRNKQMLTAEPLKSWVMIVPSRDDGNVNELISRLKQVSRPMNFILSDPLERIRVDGRRSTDFTRAIEDAMNKHRGRLQLVFIVLPNNRIDNYAAIKECCYSQHGISSQCFLAKNLTNRGLMSIATKVAIQMNAKLGGEPWGIHNPLKDSAMFVGFDVYHAGKREGLHKSIGAMAATMNRQCSRYYSVTSEHEGSQELSENLGNDLAACLKAWMNANNGELPLRIFFYRDGVGEGQLNQVYNQEVSGLKAKIKEIYDHVKRDLPRLTFTVVTKRINTRLFLHGRGDEYDNPKPGTIVDDVVTKPERYDFFLISQTARQGTVSPTHYNVLYDNKGLPPDRLQLLTYKLCSGYFNWSGTVSVPAPCQYAHKLAYMVGLAVKNKVNTNLSQYLFYL